MKTIGLLGGMSIESTQEYIRLINEGIRERLAKPHSAKILMYTVDFGEIVPLQHEGRWDELADIMTREAKRLEEAGADLVLICTNTMHYVAPQVEKVLGVPLLHIGDATAEQIELGGHSRVGLLGTKFTMEMDFYHERLRGKGIDTLVPDEADRDYIHSVIFNELCEGKIIPGSRREFQRIISQLQANGAEAIVLGCTEIPLLIQQKHVGVPIYDTMHIHAKAAVDYALQ